MRKVILFPVMVLLMGQRGILWALNRFFAFIAHVFGVMGENTDASIIHLCKCAMKGEEAND